MSAPVTRPPTLGRSKAWPISGDSRDKDGIDEVGGTDSGGCGLPGPKQWVKVATVQDRLVIHGVGRLLGGNPTPGGLLQAQLCRGHQAA